MSTFVPRNEEEVCEVVRWAAAQREALAVSGSGSRAGFGYEVNSNHGISLKEMSGIRDYDPRELVLTAAVGTPLAEIHAALTEHGQQLAFEPPDPSVLFGSAGAGTLGGVFLGNQSGPRRIHAGAARDHILGVRAVNGRGEMWKSGGKVIKNVTGYDLSKLLAGSWGTLSIITEISCKVLPASGASTVGVAVDNITTALALLIRIASSSLSPTGLAYVPQTPGAEDAFMADIRGHCLLRFEGTDSGVMERIAAASQLLNQAARPRVWAGNESNAIWRALRDAAPVAASPVVLKLSLPPTWAPAVADALAARQIYAWYLDTGGAWFWIGVESAAAVELVQALRDLLRPVGGSVVIMRAPAATKSAISVLTPQPPALAALTGRLKQSFDPLGLFNPGRLYPV